MLLNPTPILNLSISISGVTQNTIPAALEAELRVKFSVEHVDVQNFRADALEALGRGNLRAATRGLTINAQFNEEGSGADFWEMVENGVVGVDVREAVREYLRIEKGV